jgi:amidohydrolase
MPQVAARAPRLILLGLVALPLFLPALAPEPSCAASRPDFERLALAQEKSMIDLRRWLHAHPELSMRETQTQGRLREELLKIPGIDLIEGDWSTGLVAVLHGGKSGPLVAYRADIDALPIREATGLPFASTIEDSMGGQKVGVMHACGHDLHAAILIATARALSEVREEIPGSVLFVLEPGEEVGAGAQTMLEAGLFEKAGKPVAMYAIHDHSTISVGQVSYCPGRSAANVDEFAIRVLGRGGHGAYPHKTIDPVVIASHMVLAFQTIISREVDAASSAVITVGSIHGGTSSNVIPDAVDLRGTVRSLEPEIRTQLESAVIRTAKGIAASAGAPEPEIRYVLGTPSMYNDPALVDETLPVLERILGKENVMLYPAGMGGEDFSVFQQVVPGFMFRLGVGRPDKVMNIHSPEFDPDERAMAIGVRLMCEVLMERLGRG